MYQCSYHIVWTPKYRYRILEGDIGRIVDHKIRTVCEWKGIEILELNIMKDHVHMVATIPPRMSISEAMGIIKWKTAIALFEGHSNLKQKPYWGNHFWSRGYCVTTIGMDEDKISRYVKYQEDREKQEENNSKDYVLFESLDS